MELINIIAIAILVVAVGGLVGILAYKNYKGGGDKFTIQGFVDKYGNELIGILKNVVKILSVSEAQYETREEYEKAVVEMTIEKIKNAYTENDIGANILSIISTDALTNIVYDLLHGNRVNIFSVLDFGEVSGHRELYGGDEVVFEIAALNAKAAKKAKK